MFSGRLVFSQVMDFMPMHAFRNCVARYQGDYQIKSFTCLDQYLCMAFAQLAYRESLRDIEACLRAQGKKLYHMGIRGNVSRSTLADANERRDWRIYADFANRLIVIARKLYARDDFGLELEQAVYALDATTIDLCLSVFPWANFRKTKAAIKLHTLLDLRGNIPSFIHISDGKLREVNTMNFIPFEAGSFYLMDRGYLDYTKLHAINEASAFFVIRAKSNLQCRRVYSYHVDRKTGLLCDQTIMLTGANSINKYPCQQRKVKIFDKENNKNLVVLTNNFALPAITIASLYRCRWQVELFFKWIKQNLRIKNFFGNSENAVKSQIWIAISVYVLVAILKKELKIAPSLYTILQVLSASLFEKTELNQLLLFSDYKEDATTQLNQLKLFE